MPGGRRAVARNIRRGLPAWRNGKAFPPSGMVRPRPGSWFLPAFPLSKNRQDVESGGRAPSSGPVRPPEHGQIFPGSQAAEPDVPHPERQKNTFFLVIKGEKKTRDPLCIPKHGNFPDGRRRRPTYVGAPLYHSPPAENKTANNRLTYGNFTIKKHCFDSETCDASHVPVQRPSIDTIGLLEDCGKKW